ncbi:hypothetical protein WJX72_003539 [[Myrmecia] bisecta]|uniref:RNase H type-1 domain-containing protein n=1 Tax=[Myrmecia] bisecta TaxID=41462 RepID=A0AAW1QQ49_9CHLO
MSAEVEQESQFWLTRFDEVNGTALWPDMFPMFSDAGATGWGGYLVSDNSGAELARSTVTLDEWATARGDKVAQGYLTPEEQRESSTWRELTAIDRVLLSLQSFLEGKRVRLLTDNLAVEHVWEKGSRNLHLNSIVMRLFEFCLTRKVSLDIEWVPCEWNEFADQLSKLRDGNDWMLHPR